MRNHLAPTRMADTKVLKRLQKNCGALMQRHWKTAWQAFKKLNTELAICSSNSTHRYTPKRNENIFIYKKPAQKCS